MSAQPFRSMYIPPRVETVDAASVMHRVGCFDDLLAALRRARKILELTGRYDNTVRVCDAAIAKAEGRS